MGQRKDANFGQDRRSYFPWLLLALLIAIVVFVTIPAFQKSKQSPMLEKGANDQSLAKKIEEINGDIDQAPNQESKQQEPNQPSFIGKIQTKMDLNLHATPDIAGAVVAVVPDGATLPVKSKVDRWYQVVTPDSVEGYITSSTKYITIIEMKQ